MDQTPPLDELAARRRLIQAKMELHRAEMALYYQEATAPFRAVERGVQATMANPLVKAALLGGTGVLLFSGKLKWLRKGIGFLLPMLLPRLRQNLMEKTGLGGRLLESWMDRRERT